MRTTKGQNPSTAQKRYKKNVDKTAKHQTVIKVGQKVFLDRSPQVTFTSDHVDELIRGTYSK